MGDFMKLYKVLSPDGQSQNGGDLKWSLPTKKGRKWIPGEWHEVDGRVSCCRSGLHLTSDPWGKWVRWDSVVWVAEGAGSASADGDKTAFQRARLLRPAPTPKWWKEAHTFVGGLKAVAWLKPDGKPLGAWRVYPTWDAARDAARDAAWDAARDATRDAAWEAAWDATRAAAWDATWDAAWDAAWEAAWDATRAATWDATRAAARDAAWDATRDAALYVHCVHICNGTDLANEHVKHARARWRVWEKGYGCAADVNGVLYVYERV